MGRVGTGRRPGPVGDAPPPLGTLSQFIPRRVQEASSGSQRAGPGSRNAADLLLTPAEAARRLLLSLMPAPAREKQPWPAATLRTSHDPPSQLLGNSSG